MIRISVIGLFSMQSRWCADVVERRVLVWGGWCPSTTVCHSLWPTTFFYLFIYIIQPVISSIGLFTFTELANDSSRPVSSEDGIEASASNVADTSHCRSTRIHLQNCCQCAILIVQSGLTAEITLAAVNQTADCHLRELQNVLLFYEGAIDQCNF